MNLFQTKGTGTELILGRKEQNVHLFQTKGTGAELSIGRKDSNVHFFRKREQEQSYP